MKKKDKKENLKLCMRYHCKECPRARKCEDERRREEQRRYARVK